MNYVESFNLFGVEVMQLPCIKGEGEPTTATKGAVGLMYMDTVTGDMYKCTAVNGEDYNWGALVVLPANIVQSVNGKAPDQTGNVQVEAGGGGSEIFKVDLFCGCPEDDEEGWIERTLAAIRAGKIIEVHDAGEGGYYKVSYGWWHEEWENEETGEWLLRYHVGDWSFVEGGSGEGEDEGEDEGGDDYGDISDYDITIFEKEYHEIDEGDGCMADDPPSITIYGISYKALRYFYSEGVTSFMATWAEDTELGTPGEQTRCSFEFEEEEGEEGEYFWVLRVTTENDSYSDEVYFE